MNLVKEEKRIINQAANQVCRDAAFPIVAGLMMSFVCETIQNTGQRDLDLAALLESYRQRLKITVEEEFF